jgi:hypothetical protein
MLISDLSCLPSTLRIAFPYVQIVTTISHEVLLLLPRKTRAENHLALLIILHVSRGMLQVHMRNEIEGNLLSQRRTNSMAIKTDNFCVAFLFLSPQLCIAALQLLDCECNSMTINIQYLLK